MPTQTHEDNTRGRLYPPATPHSERFPRNPEDRTPKGLSRPDRRVGSRGRRPAGAGRRVRNAPHRRLHCAAQDHRTLQFGGCATPIACGGA